MTTKFLLWSGLWMCALFLQLREGYAFTRLLIEMALASNAPSRLKVKVRLRILSTSYALTPPHIF